jgi:hypothetical protein
MPLKKGVRGWGVGGRENAVRGRSDSVMIPLSHSTEELLKVGELLKHEQHYTQHPNTYTLILRR